MAQDTREVLCRKIVEGVPDAIVFADREGNIAYFHSNFVPATERPRRSGSRSI